MLPKASINKQLFLHDCKNILLYCNSKRGILICNIPIESEFLKQVVLSQKCFLDMPMPTFHMLIANKMFFPCQIDSFPSVVEAHLKHS